MSQVLELLGMEIIPNLFVEIYTENEDCCRTYSALSSNGIIQFNDSGIAVYDDDSLNVCFFPREAIKSARFFCSKP